MGVDLALLVVGGVGVWLGAEGLVRGAVRLAKYFGVSPLVVGFTVVAFGTSAPELVVSSLAAMRGHAEIALGNVVGSNIFNICLVLGLSAVISPVSVHREVVSRDIPLMLAATFVTLSLAYLGDVISRADGAILVLLFAAHTVMSYRLAKRDQRRSTAEPGWERSSLEAKYIFFLIGGIVVLAIGAEAMVRGAVGVAGALGMSQRVIGMTIVALGTSVPELAASVVAAKHGESDLALGNVVGSNLYNLLLILGVTGLIAPIQSGMAGGISEDFIFMVITSVAIYPLSRIGWRIGRLDGVLLILCYAVFYYLIFF
jgi:cation:H+ antiporter